MKHCVLSVVVLLSIASTALAQPWTQLNRLPHARQHATNSHKVAEHEDQPEAYWVLAWDTAGSDWDSLFQYGLAYLPNGDVVKEVLWRFDSNTFVLEQRKDYTYNFQPLADQELYSSWNGSAWVNQGKTEVFYDAQGSEIDRVQYKWNGSTYDTTYAVHNSYTYVFTNRVAEMNIEVWDFNLHQYVNEQRQVYHYPTVAAWDSATFYAWDGGAWAEEYRYVDAIWYDFEQEVVQDVVIQLSTMPGWEDYVRLSAMIGAWGSYSYIITQWNGATWDTTNLEIYSLDSLQHRVATHYYDWSSGWTQTYGDSTDYDYDAAWQLVQATNFDWEQGQFEPSRRYVYARFFTGSMQSPLAVQQVKAFPNPCSDQLTFRLELPTNGPVQIALYDLQGRIRMQTLAPMLVDGQVHISISSVLQNGTYLYRIMTEEGMAEGKVVVQR